MHVDKRLDLSLLARELAAAAVPSAALSVRYDAGAGPAGPSYAGDLFTYDAGGAEADLPPEAAPVVDAHVPPPLVVDYVGTRAVSAVVRTTDDQPREVFRTTTATRHVYAASFRMTAVDATSGATKRARAEMTFKGLGSGPAQVGATVASTPMQDAAAASWAIQATTQGMDLVISVKGALGRTVDWSLAGDIDIFGPEGLGA